MSRSTPGLVGAALSGALLLVAGPLAAQQAQQTPPAQPFIPFTRPSAPPAAPAPASPGAEPGAAWLPSPVQPAMRPRLSPEGQAQDGPRVDGAYGAYQAGHFITAFRMATERIAADGRDAAAMTLLAEIIIQGLGTRQDHARAATWYRLAAERGDANAAFALGMLHLSGQGAPRDEARARALLEQAAAQGHGPASLNLALPLLASGSEADLLRAIPLLQRAAEAEIGDAQHALAVLTLEGKGLPKDEDAGADMMARAAANGSLAGEVEFAILQFTGRGIGRDERAAARGFARAAARGNAIAQNRLARILFQGRWLPRDPVSAAGWHIAARSQGLGDPELDAELEKLNPADREKALAFAQDQATAYALTRPAPAAQSSGDAFRK
jgi:TPR repeat protein